MTCGVTIMRHGQLSHIGHANRARQSFQLLSGRYKSVTPEKTNGGMYSPSGLLGRFVDRAGDPHVAFCLGKPGGDFRIVYRPIFTKSIQTRGLKIYFAEARRRASPEVRLPLSLAPLPAPIGSWRIGINDVMFPQSGLLLYSVSSTVYRS